MDDQGVLRYGSSAFCGGAKVYLCGKYWTKGQNTIGVIGLNRYKRMVFDDVAPELIENVRCTKVYKPSVLKLMDNWEFSDCWWDNSPTSRKDTKRFAGLAPVRGTEYYYRITCPATRKRVKRIILVLF